MKPSALLLLLACGLAASPPVSAQDDPTFTLSLTYRVDECEGVEPGYAFKNCVGEATHTADAELNRVYQAALAALEAGEDYGWNEDRVEYLREAQRAWVVYRDADCGGAYRWEFHGGQYADVHGAACFVAKTRLRTAELAARYHVE